MVLTYEKYVRDPLYGFVGLTENEIKILDTPILQRLRRIRQLAFTHLVYPSANHTRFEHSLGVLHIATRMANQLGISDEDLKILRYAALLHDIGHGPFSHVFEAILKKVNKSPISHERITQRLIQESDILSILGDTSDQVIEMFSENNDSIIYQILSSNLDADKIDYLRRDGFHIGVAYGTFDLERILHTLGTVESGGKRFLCTLWKGADALDNFRLSRYLMHIQVYQHHTSLIAQRMLVRSVEVAYRDDAIEKSYFDVDSAEFLNKFIELDDARLISLLSTSSSQKVNDFAQRIETRNLFKRGFDVPMDQVEDPILRANLFKEHSQEKIREIETAIAEIGGVDPDYIIVNTTKIENVLFKSSYAQIMNDKTPYLIKDEKGTSRYIEQYSSLEGKEEPRTIFSVYCPVNCRKEIETESFPIIQRILS